MSFHELFPATSWLWRKLGSRLARCVYILGLAIIIIPAVALRIQAAVFEARVLSMVHALSNLRIGASSKADARAQIATLRTKQPDLFGGSRCGTDECLSTGIATSDFADSVLRKAGDLNSLLNWWGFRGGYLDVHADFTSGKVSSLGNRLTVTTPHLDAPVWSESHQSSPWRQPSAASLQKSGARTLWTLRENRLLRASASGSLLRLPSRL